MSWSESGEKEKLPARDGINRASMCAHVYGVSTDSDTEHFSHIRSPRGILLEVQMCEISAD